MSTAVWIVVIVVVVVVAVLATLVYSRKRATEQLKERFGPEYDRTVSEEGDKREAERKLSDIAERRDQLDIKDLTDAQREEYARRWEAVQVAFIDQPGEATDQADALVTDVMRTRGYPVDDFEERADLVAADHPEVVEQYRAAHAIHAANAERGSDTEELRGALVHYRALYEQLIDRPATTTEPVAEPTAEPTAEPAAETVRPTVAERDRATT